jgi:DNA topoisomerase-3
MSEVNESDVMSTVVVAEKPSVARDIARVLGARRKGEGFLEGNGYVVTWALGHLVQFAEPDDYGPPWKGRWAFSQLPMLPEPWKLKTGRSTYAQFQVVRKLLNDAAHDRIVCATDAGREGEHIFRLIYEQARCKKPFQRLWISSLTDQAIRQGFGQLQPGTAFNGLAQAARARAQADWLVGMNLTRAYTVHNKALCTIGRVQTPTLAMLARRDEAIAHFVKAYFYELVAQLVEGFGAKYSKDGQTRIDAKEEAERLHRQLEPHQTGTVVQIEKKIVRHRPPALYDLTNLQRDANRRFGFTAAKVLEYAQTLYETHKLITYPRTESRHISEDMVEQLPGILERLDHEQAPAALERLRQGHRLSRAYVDRTRLTDHHAIIPTVQKPPPTLSPVLRQLYDRVAARFVAIFLPDQVVEQTTVTLDIGGATFVARGAVELDPGWRLAEPRRDDREEAERQVIPPLQQGQTVHVRSLEVVEKETQPPKPYTDATLLAAMKNAGRDIDDNALADTMKDCGLGTPATRAEIIERLIRSGYVRRERKSLQSTEKGRALIALVAEPLRSPELTAAWEQQLQEVEAGRYAAQAFYQSIAGFVRELIPKVAEGAALSPEQVAEARQSRRLGKGRDRRDTGQTQLGACPLCQQGVVTEHARAYGCSRYREGCKFAIWKVVAGKQLTARQIQALLRRGATERLKGFKSKAGRPFAASLKLDADGKVTFDFESRTAKRERTPVPEAASAGGITCPKCGLGRIIEGKKGRGCNRYREGCDFVVWYEIAGKKLTEKQMVTLIGRGRTGVIKGFKSRSGNTFEARLRLDDAWNVAFDFVDKK